MRAQRLSALAVGVLAALGTVPCVAGPASASTTAATSVLTSAAAAPNDVATEPVVDSAASNSLVHGASGVWTASGWTFQVGGSQTYVSFAVDGIPGPGGSALTLSGRLAAPSGATLTPGTTYSGSDVPQPPISLLTGATPGGPYPLAGTVLNAASTDTAGKAPSLVRADDTSWADVPPDDTSWAAVPADDTSWAAVPADDTSWAAVPADDTSWAAVSADDTSWAAVSADDTSWAAVSPDDTSWAAVPET